jgi:hypothetical protein
MLGVNSVRAKYFQQAKFANVNLYVRAVTTKATMCCVADKEETRNAYRILVRKSLEDVHLEDRKGDGG